MFPLAHKHTISTFALETIMMLLLHIKTQASGTFVAVPVHSVFASSIAMCAGNTVRHRTPAGKPPEDLQQNNNIMAVSCISKKNNC